jgi:hypothetical protein
MSSLGTAVNIVPSSVLFDLTSKTGATYDFNTGFYQVDCNAKFTWSVIVGGINLKVSFYFHTYYFLRRINQLWCGDSKRSVIFPSFHGAMKRSRLTLYLGFRSFNSSVSLMMSKKDKLVSARLIK